MVKWTPLKKIATTRLIIQLESFAHEISTEGYERDRDSIELKKQLKEGPTTTMEGNECHLHDR